MTYITKLLKEFGYIFGLAVMVYLGGVVAAGLTIPRKGQEIASLKEQRRLAIERSLEEYDNFIDAGDTTRYFHILDSLKSNITSIDSTIIKKQDEMNLEKRQSFGSWYTVSKNIIEK